MPDYYKILGIPKDASSDEIRKAYRIKAKTLHPDVNKGTDAKFMFQQLNEAYHFLNDKDKREFYDIRLRYDTSLYRKYGKNYEYRNIRNTEPNNSYSTYASSYPLQDDEKRFLKNIKKYTDVILFYCMLAIGIAAIVFGTIDLFFSEWEGIKSLTGFLFGLSFTSLLVYGWYLKGKVKK